MTDGAKDEKKAPSDPHDPGPKTGTREEEVPPPPAE